MSQRALPTLTPGSDEPLALGERQLRLSDIALNETVELVSIELPPDQLEPLFERGMLPGCRMCPVRRSPSGDPIVLVDGSLLAFRREMAGCICVRRATTKPH
jgi:Fe2+ transport system protein FeoA